jgi:hypothetical protein
METRIALRYCGPAVESGSMDVYAATGNMLAFSEFVLLAAKTEFGKDIAARAEVAGFDRGSFVTGLVFHVTGISGTIFSGFSADQLRKIIEDAFKLWKHLRMIASSFTVLMRGSDSVREIFCPPMSASTSNGPA